MIASETVRRRGTVVLLACVLLLAGCAGSEPNGGESGSAADGGCDARDASNEQRSGAQILCQQVSGSEVIDQTFDCPDPSRSAVALATNMTAGGVTVTVTDAEGTTLFEQRYAQRGPSNDTQSINEGAPGTWTLTLDRGSAFEGSVGAQVACASQGSSGGQSPTSTLGLLPWSLP